MIEKIIYWSVKNRTLVLLLSFVTGFVGIYALKNTPVDAIPDLSDVQVIVKTSYPGQAPQVVQDQVTYPLSTAMLAVPGASSVRGFSFFGDSYVYVLFEDGTDPYWARSRVLEYLNQVSAELPASAVSQLGPDASGVGWVYIYALQDKTKKHDLSQLRSLQDWFLKFELQAVEGVAEVAAVGGMVKQYQVTVDPDKLRSYNIPLAHINMAIQRANQEIGASVIEMAEAEYMVRVSGYLSSKQQINEVPLGVSENGVPLLLRDVADVHLGPQMRRGIAELNGEGEVVGGIVVMRHGENAQAVIDKVKARLDELKPGLPDGVEIVSVYDRSNLIKNAVKNLWHKLGEELLLVALVCLIFLLHLRSALVAVISLPIAILIAFSVMKVQGINANIMSLSGIAIAIGAMIDGAIVMVENFHKHLARSKASTTDRWSVVAQSAAEVGPGLFFSLLIITVSFLPVFALEAQEGRMFAPLAFTKTYAMAAAALLSITLVPVLVGYIIRGRVLSEKDNPITRVLLKFYRPTLQAVLAWPKTILVIAAFVLLSSWWPLKNIGSEFMPELDEGDLMYMPTTYPGISIGKARELLQQTDKLISTLPEVKSVFGKIGRAETATDPAPLTMIETFIQFKPRSEWRPGVDLEDIKRELNERVNFPGLTNAWVMPIKTRIDMLATGIKTPVGIKVSGPDLAEIERIGRDLEAVLSPLDGTASVYSERVAGGRYINVDIRRDHAARYGLNIADVQQIIATAVGGMNVSETVEGLERYPINVRYPQAYRNSPEQLALLPLITQDGKRIALGDVAEVYIDDGAPVIKSENARTVGWTLVDIADIDVGSYVAKAQQRVREELDLPPGYSIAWSGQFEYMERAKQKLSYIIPLTLAIVVVLLFLNFQSLPQVLILLSTIPFSLVGSLWFIHLLGYNFSVAVGVGMIALAGVAVETGVLMLVYLDQHRQKLRSTQTETAVLDAASLRVRPVLMTAAATIVGLVPILLSSGTGSEITARLAAPMIGGMLSTVALTLFVLPVIYFLWKQNEFRT